MSIKPLFIPLKTEYFEAFKAGTKTQELRAYGNRWNEKNCFEGRTVILSKGYGKKSRMYGTVTKFEKKNINTLNSVDYQAALDCYQNPNIELAVISIKLTDMPTYTDLRKNFRRSMCDDCAFRQGAEETSTVEKRNEFYFQCHTKLFFCHKTMLDKTGKNEKFEGSYDPCKNAKGETVDMKAHQLCAGFVLLHGEDIGIDPKEIEKMSFKDHAYLDGFGNETFKRPKTKNES